MPCISVCTGLDYVKPLHECMQYREMGCHVFYYVWFIIFLLIYHTLEDTEMAGDSFSTPNTIALVAFSRSFVECAVLFVPVLGDPSGGYFS